MSAPRIFIPLLWDYYIFDYFRFLIPRLLLDGFEVTLYAFRAEDGAKYAVDHPRFRFVRGSRLLRALSNRSGNPVARLLLWVCAWGWAARVGRAYDFAIVPWDYRPLWYVITRRLPSMTLSTTTIVVDRQIYLKHMQLKPELTQKLSHRVYAALDVAFGWRVLPRMGEVVTKYSAATLWIDRLMGWSAPSALVGASGAEIVCVPGEQVRENLIALGLESARVKTVGVPNYEFLEVLRREFNEGQRRRVLDRYGIDSEKKLFTFFLSPSAFSQAMVDEVRLVVERIKMRYPDCAIVLKFHPKTRVADPPRFIAELKYLGRDLVIIREFSGDEENALLILSSYALVQKQSTVGFIAMQLKVPIISYNLVGTEYEDDMYKALGGSFHAEKVEELDEILVRLETPEYREELRKKQVKACGRFCVEERSPCGKISNLIQARLRTRQSDCRERYGS